MGENLAPPLWPAILSSITPNQHVVDFLHCGHERPTKKKLAKYDAVGISVLTSMAKDAYSVGDMCREMDVKCIMGGIHAYVLPQEAKQHCDSVILGEAEYIWGRVLHDIENDNLQSFYEGSLTRSRDFPIPDLSVYGRYRFFTTNLAEMVRGCPHNCRFCGATMYSGRRYRYKHPDKIATEIENWKHRKRIAHFTNTNLIANPKKTLEILNRIMEYNLRWWSACSVDILDHEDVLSAAADSGCLILQFGFESISRDTLKSMNKHVNVKRDYRKLVRKCHDHGIEVGASFIFGWDTDTMDVFRDTVEFVSDSDIDIAGFLPLTPFPGTAVYDELRSQGRILTDDWSKYDWNNCVFKPKNMTGQELLEGCYYAYKQIYNSRSLFNRLLSRPRGFREMMFLLLFSGFGRLVLLQSKPYWLKQKSARCPHYHAPNLKHRA